jgi:hypothetical protein
MPRQATQAAAGASLIFPTNPPGPSIFFRIGDEVGPMDPPPHWPAMGRAVPESLFGAREGVSGTP